MPKGNKKQPAKKRAYKKRANKSTTFNNADSSEWVPPIKTENKDTEVESLAAICSIFDSWDDEQKRRNLTYLCGRYYDFM